MKNRNAMRTGNFDPKAQTFAFSGYAYNSTAYLVQNLKTRKIIETRNVMFNEKNLPVLKQELMDKIDYFSLLDLDSKEKKLEQIKEQGHVELPEQAEEIRQTQEAEQIVESLEFSSSE